MSPSRHPRIYADFQKLDEQGRLILTCVGTISDLNLLGIAFEEGLRFTFYMDDADDFGNADDLEADGYVVFDEATATWRGVYEEDTLRHASDRKT